MIFIGPLIPLLVIGGAIALIIRAVGRSDTPSADTGTAVRRFFQYALLLGVYIVVAIGLSGVITALLPSPDTIVRTGDTALARSVSFLVVGIPVLYGLGRWTQRLLKDRDERQSFGWAFFLTVGSIISLITAATGVYTVLDSIAGRTDFDGQYLAQAIAWGLGWLALWRIGLRHGELRLLRIERIAGSAAGLAGTATAVWFIVTVVVRSAYDNLFEVRLIDGFGDDLWRGLSGLVVAGLVWWWYWIQHQSHAERTTSWRAYVVLIGVLGGLITAVSAGSTALFSVLQWLFGEPDTASAARHFDLLPGTITAAVVGVVLWIYHRTVLREAGEIRTETDRVYDYVVAAVGLLAAGGGIATLLVALFEAISPSGLVETGGGTTNVLVAAVTLLVVGGPLWWFFWSRIQRSSALDAVAELGSPTRRVFLFALFGVGGVVALISLIVLVFIAFEDLIGGSVTGETFREIRIPLALVITTGAIAWYHWRVFDADRESAPSPEWRSPLREVIVLGSADLAAAIGDGLHVRVQRWEPVPMESGAEPSPTEVLEKLSTLESEHALVQVRQGLVEVTPFRR